MKKKNEPLRTCLGCGKKRGKKELIRLSFCNGIVVIDESKLLTGRGAYVCPALTCIENLIKNKRLYHALKINKFISLKESFEKISVKFNNNNRSF